MDIKQYANDSKQAALTWLRWQLDAWRLELGLIEVVPFNEPNGRVVITNGMMFMVKDKE